MNISTSTVESGKARSRFALSGRSAPIDTRIEAARRDLADVRLADRVFAPHYASPVASEVTASGPVFSGKNGDSDILSEVIAGERFDILEIVGDWCWGVSAVDGTVGYVYASQLGTFTPHPFIVTAPQVTVYSHADAQSKPVGHLPMATRLKPPRDDCWIDIASGFVAAQDCEAVDSLEPRDIADIALSLVGVPYGAGGRSGAGVSDSGLVFLTLQMAGIRAPRFRDHQADSLGWALNDGEAPARGDLVFFADHVAIRINAEEVVHCDASIGTVVREPLANLIADSRFGAVTVQRRVMK